MAKGKRKQSAKQRAASIRNLAKARSARKRATKRHPVKPYSYHRKAKTVRVRAHKSWEGRGARRGGGRRRSKQTAKQRAASIRNLRKARAARRGGGHRASETRRRSSRRSPKRSRALARRSSSEVMYEERPRARSGRRRRARKNPLGAMELFIGGFTLLLGFGTADFTDRMWATHALTDKNTKDASGNELYADSPPTTNTSYPGMYNPSAITAPMNAVRWLSGGLLIVVPIGIANIKAIGPVGKSSLQMFGFGAATRVLGKGLIDLLAFMTRKTATGQRLYDGELRAMALRRADGSEASLPSAGLGKPAGCACGGTCTSCQQVAARVNAQNAAGAGAPPPTGTGWPSTVREVAKTTTTAPPGPTPPVLAPPPPPPPPPSPPLTGVPRPRANPYRWGEDKAA